MAELEFERLELRLVDDPSGRLTPYQVLFDDGPQPVRDGLRFRYGRDGRGKQVVVKSAVGGPAALALLSREAVIGRWLYEAAPGEEGAWLSRYIGQNDVSPRPYIVCTYSGNPLRDLVEQGGVPLPPDRFADAVDGLLDALQFLYTARVVHGRIGLDSLRWDGHVLQLGDFGHAQIAGRPRPYPPPAAPWAAPWPAGRNESLCADDVYAGALAVFLLGTGEALENAGGLPEDAAGLRDRLALQSREIRDLLSSLNRVTGREADNAFADDPAARPTARTMRVRWRPQSPRESVLAQEIDRRGREGREQFAALRERQQQWARRGAAQAGPQPQIQAQAQTRWQWTQGIAAARHGAAPRGPFESRGPFEYRVGEGQPGVHESSSYADLWGGGDPSQPGPPITRQPLFVALFVICAVLAVALVVVLATA